VSLGQARATLALGVLLFVVRASLYAGLLPVNEMPDELEHFKQIVLAWQWDRVGPDRAKAQALLREVEADYYYLASGLDQRPDPATVHSDVPTPDRTKVYFRLAGWLLGVAGVESLPAAWYLLRALSILSGLAVLLCAWAAARQLCPERPEAAAAAALVLALHPQFGALSAVLSTDQPAELAGAVFFLLLARLARRPAWPAWLGVGVILAALPVLKKTAFYLVIPAALAGLPWWRAWLGRLRRPGLVRWGLPTLLSAGFLALAFVPALGRLAVRLLGQPLLRLWGGPYEREIFGQPGMVNALLEHVRPTAPTFWHHLALNAQSNFQSWWATYGFLNLPLEAHWYWAAWLTCLLALAGWVRLLYRPGADWLLAPWQGRAIGLLAAGAALNLLVVFIRQSVFVPETLSQGRYMFPSLVPWVVLLTLGFLALWPERWQRPALAGALVGLAAMDLAGLWRVIGPFFYRVAF
jgi:hypothetical protein